MKRFSFFPLVALFLILLIPFSSQAQVPLWSHSWGGSDDDEGYSVAVDQNGNIYLAGYTRSFGAGHSDVLLLKYHSSGNLLWQKTWGGSNYDWGTAVAVDTSGNVYVAGGTKSFGAGWSDAFILKFDSTGSLIWSKIWGGSSYEVAYDISFDNSGNIYVAAETYSYGCAAAVLKFNTNGDFLWSRTWGSESNYDCAYSIEVDSNGNIYLAGISWYYWPEVLKILLLKFDSGGNLLWARRWGGSGRDEAWGSKIIRVDNSGNLYLGCRTKFGAGDSDALLLKFDGNGNLIWSRTWGGTGFESIYGLSIGCDGSIYVAGETGSFGTGKDVFLLQYDSSGSLLSQETWGDGGDQTAHSIVIDETGNIFLAGSAPNNSGGWQDITGTTSTPSGTLSSPSGTVGSPAGVISSPTATITTPSGVTDTGGGGADALVLKCEPGGEYQPFYFVHITDPHVWKWPYAPVLAYQRWLDILDIIKTWNPPPDFVLCSGDLVDYGVGVGGILNYEALLEPLHKYNGIFYIDSDHTIPIYFCPGNHDAATMKIFVPVSFTNYNDSVGPDYYVVSHKNCAIFSMNSGKDKDWPDACPEGDGLDDQYENEVTRLPDDLDALDGEYNNQDNSQYCKIIMMHHPYKNPGEDPLEGVFWNNRAPFINACVDYGVDAVVCGHLHGAGTIMNVIGDPWQPGDGTRFIITNAIVYDASYRKMYVSPTGDIDSVSEMEHFFSTISGEVSCQTVVHIYDDKGNHDGPDENGDIEIGIPGSYYSYWVIDTLGINLTYTEFSVYKADTTDYTFVIEGLGDDDSMNVSLRTTLKEGIWNEATYENIPMHEGSIASLYANESVVDYTMTIVDPDSSEREVRPSSWEGNLPPVEPSTPSGPTTGFAGDSYSYSTNTTDPEDDQVYYMFDWGDETYSDWLGPFNSGDSCTVYHSWTEPDTYNVRVRAIDTWDHMSDWSDHLSIIITGTDVQDETGSGEKPSEFTLFQNYPNPFNPITKIEFTLAKSGFVSLNIYDLLGRKVKTLVSEHLSSGYKSVLWDGKNDSGEDVASGIYFYQIKAGVFSETKKMVLLR